MMSLLRRSVGIALRIVIAGACCFGIWCSWTLARADYLFQKDTEESVRSAIRLVPDGWEYYMRLAQFDQKHTRELLTTSLRLNRYDAQANIATLLVGRVELVMLQLAGIQHADQC